MIKKVLFAAVIAGVSGSCLANWTGDLSYINLGISKNDATDANKDLNFGLISTSVGFEIPVNENFSVIPEVQYAFNVKDDDYTFTDDETGNGKSEAKINQLYGFNLRAQFNFTPEFYAYVQPQYTRYYLKGTTYYGDGGTDKVQYKETRFGYGAGVGYQFNPRLAANLGYLKIDGDYFDLDGWKLGMRYKF